MNCNLDALPICAERLRILMVTHSYDKVLTEIIWLRGCLDEIETRVMKEMGDVQPGA